MSLSRDGRIKVLVPHDPGQYESMWADPVAPRLYRLANTPCFAYNVSLGDILEARLEDGTWYVGRIQEKSGHRTIRVDFPMEVGGLHGEKGRAVIEMLKRLGCHYERFEPRLLAIDVPPEVNLGWLAERLTRMEAIWEYGDPQPDVNGFF